MTADCHLLQNYHFLNIIQTKSTTIFRLTTIFNNKY